MADLWYDFVLTGFERATSKNLAAVFESLWDVRILFIYLFILLCGFFPLPF